MTTKTLKDTQRQRYAPMSTTASAQLRRKRSEEEQMSPDPEHTADPEQPEGGFAEGEASPEEHPEEEHVGRFSEGQEELGEDDPEKHHEGRFSEGQEELGEDDPEKHEQGRFSEGQDSE